MDIKLVLTVVAPILTCLLGFLLNKYFYNRPRLVAFYGHIATLKLDTETQPITSIPFHTHTVIIRNTGKVSAKNVRVNHTNLKGISFNITPKIDYQTKKISEGGKEIIFPVVVPNEQINISYLYLPPTTFRDVDTIIKSDEGYAKIIQVIPTPTPSMWQKNIFYILLFVGSSTIIYWIGLLLVFFWKINQLF